jgi:regulator of protease activity HflC (stomatin/prohibitin superfamily)
MDFLIGLAIGTIATFIVASIVVVIGNIFQLWRVLPERTVVVYTFFGKVVGQVDEPGIFFPVLRFGPKALLFP